jgi:hypothetical protein
LSFSWKDSKVEFKTAQAYRWFDHWCFLPPSCPYKMTGPLPNAYKTGWHFGASLLSNASIILKYSSRRLKVTVKWNTMILSGILQMLLLFVFPIRTLQNNTFPSKHVQDGSALWFSPSVLTFLSI